MSAVRTSRRPLILELRDAAGCGWLGSALWAGYYALVARRTRRASAVRSVLGRAAEVAPRQVNWP